MTTRKLVVFGYCGAGASSALRHRFAHFAEILSKRARSEVSLFEAGSYEELASAVVAEYVDLAWLPPIAYLALARRGAVAPLVHMHRDGSSSFHSVLIVRADAPFRSIFDLRGTRAAWVDQYSASGFVVPRVRLAEAGVDPRAFSDQRFWRSHESVVRAVVGGRADFGATYAGVDRDGGVTRGPWLDVRGAEEGVRVLAGFGGIPGDVVAARHALDDATRERVLRALLAISRDKQSRLLASDAFGVDEFRAFVQAGYDELTRLTEEASLLGLLEIDDVLGDTGAHAVLLEQPNPRRG